MKHLPWKTIGLFSLVIFAAAAIRGFVFSELDELSTPIEQIITLVIGVFMLVIIMHTLSKQTPSSEDPMPIGLPWAMLLLILGALLIVILESAFLGAELLVSSLRIFEIFYWFLSCKIIRKYNVSPVIVFAVVRMVFKSTPILIASFLLPTLLTMLPNHNETVFAMDNIRVASLLIMFFLVALCLLLLNKQTMMERNPQIGMAQSFDLRCHELARHFCLTPREEEVMTLMAKGRSKTRIADNLCLSLHTVQGYAKNVYAKVGVHNIQDLIDLVESTQLSE